MSTLEIIGFITGVLGVWLTAKGKILAWPVGIINVIVYCIIFYQVRLLGDMWLQLFYLLMAVVGWIQWNKEKEAVFTVKKVSLKEWMILGACSIVMYAFMIWILTELKGALPLVDGLTTTMSLAATWLTIKKKFENWHIWIVTDLIYTGMYLNKELYLTAVLYFIFTILAVYGLLEWKKKLA
jgi:nicotinamide mononucleotide transporter